MDSFTVVKRFVKSKTLVYSSQTFEPVPNDEINLPGRKLIVAKMQYGIWPLRSYHYVALWGETEHDRKLAKHQYPGTVYGLVNIADHESEREALLELVRQVQKGLQTFANVFGVTAPELHQRILLSLIIGTDAPDIRNAPDDFLMGSDLMREKTQ